MSTTITEEQPVERRRDADSSVVLWVALLAGLSAVVGGLSAVFWASVVTLPTWRIDATSSSAVMSERGVTQIVSADVWFVITGALVGVGLGLVTWKWFRPLGWPTALLAVAAGLLAGVVCWQVGQLLGPGSEADRIAAAEPGSVIPAALRLRAVSALAVWGFAAITPVLLISSLGPDDEDASSRRRRPRRQAPGPAAVETGTVDERGVLTVPEETTG
ncbi:MAG: hypothetical protein QM779_04250 [Propionicimonas sp.]|uniref:hypothetical protein n=1 Tax=Propionicimonas sp. TaxID=1955623 RepID=UPI003D13E1CE